LLLAALLFASPTLAAAPPRAAVDTIYALAVDSTRYRDESFVYLLDDGVLRYEADGRGSTTYRQVIQILKEGAIEQWAERSFGYEPRHQKLTVNWIRVVSLSGEVISDKPAVSQDADIPAPMGDPTYAEQKERRFSLSNVRPGTLIDYSYTVEELKPFRASDFFSAWRVTTGLPVRRSRLVLDTPVGIKPRVVERNLNFKPVSVEANGRRVTTWATQEVPKIEPELFAADSNDVMMTIQIGAPAQWQDIGAWYAGLARDRYAMTPSVEQKLSAVVAGSRTLEDSLKAIHRYVTADVRYVAISLGMGGYQPRSAADVVATGYGDCKDKATLFITFLTRLGIEANPVLLSAGGQVERRLPTIAQFNHAIAAVERPGGRLFVDLTAAGVPWGSLPGADQGQFALVVHPDGRTEETTLPERDDSAEWNRLELTGSLDTTGYATTRAETVLTGGTADMYHNMIARSALDSAGRSRFLRSLAGRIYPEAEGDSLGFTDKTENGGDFRVSFVARHGRAARLAGPVAILSLPFIRLPGDMGSLITELKSHPPRRFTIDASEVPPPGNEENHVRLELPEGWRAELPKNVALTGPFGELSITYAQQGRMLDVRTRRVAGKGILGPERIHEVIAWLERVGAETRESGSLVLMRKP
jgi:transglutaminase-like putative cysteine protease